MCNFGEEFGNTYICFSEIKSDIYNIGKHSYDFTEIEMVQKKGIQKPCSYITIQKHPNNSEFMTVI